MKKRIVLISCVSKKLNRRAKAKNIYISQLFKKSMAYAQLLQPDEIYILSSKHGLLEINKEIDPYNQTLINMPTKDIERWSANVVNQLKEVSKIDQTEFIFLAGEKYRRFILPHIRFYKIPLEGLSIGKQLNRLNELIS